MKHIFLSFLFCFFTLIPSSFISAQTCSELTLSKVKSVQYTIKSSTTSVLDYTIEVQGDRIYSIYRAPGYEIKSYSKCVNDTIFIYKGECPHYTIKDGDTVAVAYYGVNKIPLHLQVGDSLLSNIEYVTNSFSLTEQQEAPHTTSYIMGNYIYSTTTIHKADVTTRFNIVLPILRPRELFL